MRQSTSSNVEDKINSSLLNSITGLQHTLNFKEHAELLNYKWRNSYQKTDLFFTLTLTASTEKSAVPILSLAAKVRIAAALGTYVEKP